MPALDRYHEPVRKALLKDGWTITDDPLQLSVGKRILPVDLGIGAERENQRITVEIKTLAAPRLSQTEPGRELYLAVSEEIRDSILSEELGQLMLREYIDHLFYFSVEREEIIEWKP